MTAKKERAIVVSAIKHAAPYIRLFKGKVFVLKSGGVSRPATPGGWHQWC